MKSTSLRLGCEAFRFLLVAIAVGLLVSLASAQNVQHLTITQPGGMPGAPIVTGISRGTNQVTVTWDGPSGYYQLFQKGLGESKFQAVGGPTNLSRRATVGATKSNAVFKVQGPAPQYVGSQNCAECHQGTHDEVFLTLHTQAFSVLVNKKQDKNPQCLPCHTVGYGHTTGFVSASATPQLRGVQCENCHGPAGNHAANPDDPTVRPRVELASTVCGGCHTPTYNQWNSSGHAVLVEDFNSPNQIDSCGRCHSGSVRESLFEGKPLPVGDANVTVVCATCHDPHANTGNPAQLLSPTFSTNNYFITTSGSFLSQYNPNINICAQCHNHRGASVTSTSRAPHHSPQYNILLGSVGELNSGPATYAPSTHALLTNQCVFCHMQKGAPPDQFHNATHSHTFTVDTYAACKQCHNDPAGLVNLATNAISILIQDLKISLDGWATNNAPLSLRAKYGTRAWEYSTPGDLSPGGPGPNSTEQALIPTNIQKARFNLYLVLYDASFGVHNVFFSQDLLFAAQAWVAEESNK
jgi:hypothetical protein